jgi:hypothetical protein
LCEDAVLRARMGTNGRTLVKRSYSIDKMLDRMEAVYRNLAHDHRA